MTSRKRVSFGSSGSSVETWIIDDVRSHKFSSEVKQFGSSEFYDDVMPTSRDIVLVTQPINCKHSNHVVLNDPVSIFRKDLEMSSKQTTKDSQSTLGSQSTAITTQPTSGPVLDVPTKNVNISTTGIITGNIEINPDNSNADINGKTQPCKNSPSMQGYNNNINNNNKNSNNNYDSNNSSAVISTTQNYHKGKRNSISSNSSGSQSFRNSKLRVPTSGKCKDTPEEYYDVLNPEPVGQTFLISRPRA